VVGPAHPGSPVVVAEFEQERGQVVGERTILHAGGAERVPHRDVGEQSGRWHRERADREQGLEQPRLVEQRIGSLFEHQSLVPRALDELLKPDRLSVILLDAETNRLAVTYDTHPVPAHTDDPLLQLALRRGPLAFPKDVREEARRRGAELSESPASWLGAPLVA